MLNAEVLGDYNTHIRYIRGQLHRLAQAQALMDAANANRDPPKVPMENRTDERVD